MRLFLSGFLKSILWRLISIQTQTINGETEISPTKKRGYQKIQSITVIGKRYVDGSNTYHTVLVLVNGVLLYQSPVRYGYEDHYIQTAENAFPLPDGYIGLPRFCRDNQINYFATCADVRTKKELI